MRPGHFFLLALLIGFLSYRAALATFPSERMWAQTPEGRVDTHFDAVTGIMVSPPAYTYPESGMYAHWFRSAMFGFAVVPLFFIALWWLARRRRAERQRRRDAVRGISTALALALSLLGCGSVVPPWERVELLTRAPLTVGGGPGCYTAATTGLLVVDPMYGTAIGALPVMWPLGYIGRRVGSEVEVLDRDGKLVATTGRIYELRGGSEGLDPRMWVYCGGAFEQ